MATGGVTVPHRPDSVPGVDILSHDVYAQGVPLDGYDVYRATAPVAWVNEAASNGHAGAGFWAITRWDDVVAIHKDWRRFSSEMGGTEIEELEPDAIVARRTMLETDPPRHTRLRQLVNPTFSRATVQTYADHARALVDDVLSEALIASRGAEPVDAVAMIARELPIRMLTGLLGVPDEDAPTLFHWADQIVYHADPEYSEAVIDRTDTDPYRLLPFRSPTSLRVFEYVNRLSAAARGSDRGDVISVLERATGRRRAPERTGARHLLPAPADRGQRNDTSLADPDVAGLRRPSAPAATLARRSRTDRLGGGGGAALGVPADPLPADCHRGCRAAR